MDTLTIFAGFRPCDFSSASTAFAIGFVVVGGLAGIIGAIVYSKSNIIRRIIGIIALLLGWVMIFIYAVWGEYSESQGSCEGRPSAGAALTILLFGLAVTGLHIFILAKRNKSYNLGSTSKPPGNPPIELTANATEFVKKRYGKE